MKRSLDDLLSYIDDDLKIDLVQSELDKYGKTNDNKIKSTNESNQKIAEYIQNIVTDYSNDKQQRILFLYETIVNNIVYFNVVYDITIDTKEMLETIDSEMGTIVTKLETKDNILYVNDKPKRKIRIFGKSYRLEKIKE